MDLVTWPNPPNADLKRDFTVPQVAEKHNWAERFVWSIVVFDYIEMFYNSNRLHSHLEYKSPNEYEIEPKLEKAA